MDQICVCAIQVGRVRTVILLIVMVLIIVTVTDFVGHLILVRVILELGGGIAVQIAVSITTAVAM